MLRHRCSNQSTRALMYYARAGSSGPFAQFANWRGPRTPIPPPGVSPLCLSLRRYTYTRAAAAVFVRVPLRVCVYTRLCERSRSLDLYRPLSIFCNLLFEKSAQRTNSKAARERGAQKRRGRILPEAQTLSVYIWECTYT